MERNPARLVPMLFAAIACSALVVGLVVGHPLVLLTCAAICFAAASLAFVSARRQRATAVPSPLASHWWKLLLGGAALMAALVAITTATGELPDNGWFVAMVTGLLAIVLMSVGLVLGATRLASRAT